MKNLYCHFLVVQIIYCTTTYYNIAFANKGKEEAIYNAKTINYKPINAVEIIRTDTGEQLYYNSVPYYQYTSPWDLSVAWQLFAFSPESTDPVPEEVQVSWRKLPNEGQELYRGDIVEPFRIRVRSKIPQDVLRKNREDGYDLAFMFLVGRPPVTFCWRLGDYKSRPPSNFVLQAGGSCLKDPYFANRDPNIGIKIHEQINEIAKMSVLPVRENWSVAEIRQPDIKNVSYYIPKTGGTFSKTLPEELAISWEATKGKYFGPYTIKVRSLIPEKYLKLINNDFHHIIISININNKMPTVCWELKKINGKIKTKGGDC